MDAIALKYSALIITDMENKKINIAIVGLGFGAEFRPIYQRHTNA